MKTCSTEQNSERLACQITELAAHIHAATYRLLCLIHEFDSAAGWEGFGMLSCAHWLNWRCGISLGVVREKVRVAHALVEVPQISAAFEQGAVVLHAIQAAIDAFAADAAGAVVDLNQTGSNTTGAQPLTAQPPTAQLDVSAETSVADPQSVDSHGQRRADAWVRLAEAALGSELIPPVAAERYQTIVHIPQTLPDRHLDSACYSIMAKPSPLRPPNASPVMPVW